jgi:carbon starvation protein
MNAAVVCVLGLVCFGLGYALYSRWISRAVFGLRADEPVPARALEDGVDYVPTRASVLWGHHYASIAGAAPIIGPAVAVIWGWVPALIWVILGAIFMGAVHDLATLVISVRHQGRSVGQIAELILSPRVRTLFLLVIFCLVLLVIAVFAKAIAALFVAQPGTVIPINFEIIVALLMGWLCYKKKIPLLVPSLVALVSLYAMVWVGVQVPVSLTLFGADKASQELVWVVLLLVYSFVASVLPVWVLLQPRDYINSHQLLVGLGGLIVGLLVAQPLITAPAWNMAPADAPSWFPFLFVTIACGAISGFHGLVSSGTTSKQLACATDARAVGYGAMLGEGVLALLSTLAVSAGLADWGAHYHSFAHAASHGVGAFVEGAATFLVALSIPGLGRGPAEIVVAVLVISFAATSLDTGVRIQRYILEELGEVYRVKALQNRYVAGGVAVLPPLGLVLIGQEGLLWPLFGSSNQLLAGLSLVVVAAWLFQQGRLWWPVAVPMVLVLAITALSLVLNVATYLEQGKLLLAVLATALLGLELWVVAEGVAAVRRPRRALARAP